MRGDAGTFKYSIEGADDAAGWYGTLEIDEFAYASGTEIGHTYIKDIGIASVDVPLSFSYTIRNCTIYNNKKNYFINFTNQETGYMSFYFSDLIKPMHSNWRIGNLESCNEPGEIDSDFRVKSVYDYDQLPEKIYLRNGMNIQDEDILYNYNFNLTKI